MAVVAAAVVVVVCGKDRHHRPNKQSSSPDAGSMEETILSAVAALVEETIRDGVCSFVAWSKIHQQLYHHYH